MCAHLRLHMRSICTAQARVCRANTVYRLSRYGFLVEFSTDFPLGEDQMREFDRGNFRVTLAVFLPETILTHTLTGQRKLRKNLIKDIFGKSTKFHDLFIPLYTLISSRMSFYFQIILLLTRGLCDSCCPFQFRF